MAMLARHQRVVIALSVHILRTGSPAARTCAWTAWRFVWRFGACYCIARNADRSSFYWDAACQENEFDRAPGVTDALNGIVRQRRLAGRYEETSR